MVYNFSHSDIQVMSSPTVVSSLQVLPLWSLLENLPQWSRAHKFSHSDFYLASSPSGIEPTNSPTVVSTAEVLPQLPLA